jgi:two-component system chemotaxis response regulator CheB
MLAQRLDAGSNLTVREAVDGEALVPGTVLVAPGGRHLALKRTAAGASVVLSDDPPENFCRPAVDVLFRSVAAVFRDRALGVVLTGMGRDGAAGAKLLRDSGGEVFVQDEQTSVVWGMPGAVVQAGQADRVLPLADVPRELTAALGRRNATQGASPGQGGPG